MRIKKTSQYIEGGASISNVYGTSTSNGYSQNYINGINTYSTSEIRAGTWIGKPLYRKIISVDSPTMPLNVNHNVSNIGYLKLDAYFTQDNITAPTFYSTSTDFFRVFRNDTVLSARCGSGNNPTNITFIMEYTKTTD